jgi:hypothetical protein
MWSDAQTLWFHGVPALGVPGAASWQAAWSEYVEGLTVSVWQEPDSGGETFGARVGASCPDCRIITPPEGCKDISECHIAERGPDPLRNGREDESRVAAQAHRAR